MSIGSFFKTELSQVCAIKLKELDIDAPLIGYGVDSVRAFDLICALEDEYDIEIVDEIIPQLKTARLVIEHVENLIGQ